MQDTPFLADSSSCVFCPLVQATFRRLIFGAIYNLAHPGIQTTRCLIASCFIWPCLTSQVVALCQIFQHCQWALVMRQPAAVSQPIVNPAQRFSPLHILLVGPLPATSSGHTHLLTILDRST
jgi:hypothetical protein